MSDAIFSLYNFLHLVVDYKNVTEVQFTWKYSDTEKIHCRNCFYLCLIQYKQNTFIVPQCVVIVQPNNDKLGTVFPRLGLFLKINLDFCGWSQQSAVCVTGKHKKNLR